MKVTIEIEYAVGEDDVEYMEVQFEGNPYWDDDSFSYSYGSIDGVAGNGPFVTMDDAPTWNKNAYSDDQNKIIEEYLKNDGEHLIDKICEEYEKRSKEYDPS